jgi:hypothetical protein
MRSADVRSVDHEQGMAPKPVTLFASAIAILVAVSELCCPADAQAADACDPIDPISDIGWSVVPSLETVGVVDGRPYQVGTSGAWFVERTTTRIPFCNYYNEIGIYSMRSYTLEPEVTTERILICESAATGRAGAVSPYTGPCPPT